MRDPYSVLGVAKSASTSEIKSAYRRLAKQYHPDQNKTDTRAKDRFTEISAAYDILGDEDKRRRFDRGEIDAEGKPKFAGNPFGTDFGGFSFRSGARSGRGRRGGASDGVDDILREFMSGMGAGRAQEGGRERVWTASTSRGEDLEVDVTLAIEDLVSQDKVRVALPNGRTVDLKVPAGVEDGQQIRLRGQGESSPTGSLAGDAIMTVRIAPHERFRREGADLYLDLPVTLYDAVLGAKVKAPTPAGNVMITVPRGAGVGGGKRLRLRGRGLPAKSGERGDLIVTLQVALPAEPDPRLTALMERWREKQPYDPVTGTPARESA